MKYYLLKEMSTRAEPGQFIKAFVGTSEVPDRFVDLGGDETRKVIIPKSSLGLTLVEYLGEKPKQTGKDGFGNDIFLLPDNTVLTISFMNNESIRKTYMYYAL